MRKNEVVRREPEVPQKSPYPSIRETNIPCPNEGGIQSCQTQDYRNSQWVMNAGSSSILLSCIALFSDSLILTFQSSVVSFILVF